MKAKPSNNMLANQYLKKIIEILIKAEATLYQRLISVYLMALTILRMLQRCIFRPN